MLLPGPLGVAPGLWIWPAGWTVSTGPGMATAMARLAKLLPPRLLAVTV